MNLTNTQVKNSADISTMGLLGQILFIGCYQNVGIFEETFWLTLEM